ncbi:MAG: TetR/AcrR family transcriptional regulator [Kofleriaceae bacterium]|nr:TetR/AcrR family transcriptional regulator [Kofleriaceae bacterium]MCL4224762.1 TetR/AcrR family transcriptional regulator [Myxococcales bacterium]
MTRRRSSEPRVRDPERTKAKILSAATDLFTRLGPGATSIDEISERAGVNRGLIHHYFRTKDALFDQVLVRPLTSFLEQHIEFLQARPDVDGLCEATRSFFRFLGRHPDLVRLLSWTLAMRRVLLGEGAQLELTRALMARLVRRIEDAQAAGAVRAEVSAPHLLITVVDLCVSWHLAAADWSAKLGWTERPQAEVDEERLAAIVDVIAAAARPHPAAAAPALAPT